VLRRREVEAHGDFILGPVSPKEYKDTVAELNRSRNEPSIRVLQDHSS
jgi:hypothetical protein